MTSDIDPVVFIYICGEYECVGLPDYRLWPLELVEEHNGFLISLEHRYFGQSQPFADWGTDNLGYLTVEQALEDLAQFIPYMLQQVVQDYNLPYEPKVFTIGASYPGMMSAYFRLKYPHLTVGSIASSAVVQPEADMPEYDTHTSQVIPGYCSDAIRAVTKAAEQDVLPAMSKYGWPIQEQDNLFGFFLALIDEPSGLVQYSNQTGLCDRFEGVDPAQYVRVFDDWWSKTVSKEDVFSYSLAAIQNTTIDTHGATRPWTWMCCQQVGWFQSAPAADSLRSHHVTIEAFYDQCAAGFGIDRSDFLDQGGFLPAVDRMLVTYGGREMQGTRISFVNGGDDPWGEVGMYDSDSEEQPSVVVRELNMGHACDLVTPADSDPQALIDARARQKAYVNQWIEAGFDY
eukprot:gnl/Dysnectes_brevis/2453_a2924_943.p1 GENE.gnl/Dysnectes_brevis/2453_a2924_943~~gnl/Dysnectes_brevis/2453_a2924_943.p1  ORF type:complete len:461 (+),score=208.59 gnl/Dysnectes_brevis/2453_a2924_943:182-1384(+)